VIDAGTSSAINAMHLLTDGSILVVGYGTDGDGNQQIAMAELEVS